MVAVGAVKLTAIPAAPNGATIFIFDGQAANVRTGATGVAVTVTVKQQVCTFPQASVARKHTCVVPTANTDPLAGPEVCVTVAPPAHVVVALGVAKVTTVPVAPAAAVTFVFAGQDDSVNTVLTGVGNTVTVDQAVVVLPHASVASQVRVTEYPAGHGPPVVTSENTITGAPHASFAEGVPNTGTAGQVMVVFAGTDVNTGAVLSTIVKVALSDDDWPQASVAVKVTTREPQAPLIGL